MYFNFLAAVALLPSFSIAFSRWGPPRPSSTSLGTATEAMDGEVDEQLKTCDVLSLDSIRSSLIRQEETIIFALIERAQFRRNDIVYKKGGFGSLGVPPGSTPNDTEELSFMEYLLSGTEALHCQVRRYTSPEEHAFFPDRLPIGPKDCLPSLDYSEELLSPIGGASGLNYNKRLLKTYVNSIIPLITQRGDDEQHGSTAICDVTALQALSRRVHYGKFVAESKYRSDPKGYQALVDAGDADGVMRLLTNEAVEKKVLKRARLKASQYGTEPLLAIPQVEGNDRATFVAGAAAQAVIAALEATNTGNDTIGKVDPGAIESIYRDIIITLTKDIEVAYLFLRCGRDPPEGYMP